MPLYGAREETWGQFAGLNLEVDPTELPKNIGAVGSFNVDFEGETLVSRLGATPYNATAPVAAKIQGIGVYYPRSGSRVVLMAANGAVYADRNQDGDFADANETLVSGLSATDPVDFWQVRDKLYFGTKTNGVYSWDGVTAAAALVAPITAPAAAATLAPDILQVETFDATAWTSTNAALTSAYDATIRREGTNCLKLTSTGAGALNAFVYRAMSAGATVDLSDVEKLVFWVYGNLTGLQFQVGIYDDTQTTLSAGPTWGRFPTFTVREANVWTKFEVPLGDIKATDRDACPGIAIKVISDGGRLFGTNPVLYFDDGRAQSGMTPDHYEVRYTYATVDSNGNVIRESAPSAAAVVDLTADAPFRGLSVGVTASGDAAVNQIRVYRYRNDGFWPRLKLVKTASNATATLTDRRDDGAVDLDAASAYLQLYRDAPPKASTYAVGKHRLWAGNVSVGGTTYPNRIYCSTFNDPESFSPSEHVYITDPTSAGWFDLPLGENIQRIMATDDLVLIFTDTGIWSVEGDGWDNFSREPRATVGLDARWAVAHTDRLFYFLAKDGVRVLAPNGSFAGGFPTWVISEPVESALRAMATATRTAAAMGLDERGRVHLTYGAAAASQSDAVIFDPRQSGSLSQSFEKYRPGWTFYQSWPWAVMHALRRDGKDYGGLLGAARNTNSGFALGKLYYLQQDSFNAQIIDTALAFAWYSPALNGHAGGKLESVYVSLYLNFSVSDQGFGVGVAVDFDNAGTLMATITGPALGGAFTSFKRLARRGNRLQAYWVSTGDGSSFQHKIGSVALGYHRRR